MNAHDLANPAVVAGLLKRLRDTGGCLVSSTDCSDFEITDARLRGDFYLDGGFGYVIRRAEWLRKHSKYERHAGNNSCEGPRS